MIQVCGERVLSENRMKRKRLNNPKNKKKKTQSESRKTRKKVGEDTKIGRIR